MTNTIAQEPVLAKAGTEWGGGASLITPGLNLGAIFQLWLTQKAANLFFQHS
jgi:hypothetical protein